MTWMKETENENDRNKFQVIKFHLIKCMTPIVEYLTIRGWDWFIIIIIIPAIYHLVKCSYLALYIRSHFLLGELFVKPFFFCYNCYLFCSIYFLHLFFMCVRVFFLFCYLSFFCIIKDFMIVVDFEFVVMWSYVM